MIKYPVITAFFALAFASAINAQQKAPVSYPKIAAYVGILHPLVTYSSNSKPHYNFDDSYVVGMPVGINIWKNAKVGFSVEFVPLIRSADGLSKMNNFLFHPGALFALGNGFTLATRAAFETSGRFGFTPVLNKIVRKGKQVNYFVAVPVPARFGNDLPASLTVGFQFGIVF